MKRTLFSLVALAALLLAACDAPTGALPDAPDAPTPKNARVLEHVFAYEGSMAIISGDVASVAFDVAEATTAAYDIRVYFEEAGTWAQLPYTLAGDYCGDLIDLAFFYRHGQVTMTITPNTLRMTDKVLPPPTRVKVVTVSPVGS